MAKDPKHRPIVDQSPDSPDGSVLPSLELARSLLAHSVDAIMLSDVESLELSYANAAAERMLGRSAADIMGMRITSIHPECDMPYVLDQFARQAKGEFTLARDIPVQDAKGEVSYHDVQSVPIEVEGRKYLMGCFRDVSERRSAARLIKESDDRFVLAIEALPMGLLIYHLDEDDRLIFSGYNSSSDRILGVDNEQFMGKTLEEAFPPLADTRIPAAYRKVASEGGVWRDDRVSYEHGSIKGAFEVVAFQLRPGDVAVMFWDITERKKAEQEMCRLMAAINSMQESVVITDPKGLILYANPSFEKLTGYTLNEVRGQPIGIYKSGKHDKAFYDSIWKILGEGQTWTGNFINKRKDGTLFEEYASITPVQDSTGKVVHFVAVKRDMTHERDLERRVVRSQKMAALGQFAHRIAHDVTNSLTTILGSAELLARAIKAEERQELSDGITQSVERIAGLTSDLMSFANPGKMSMKHCLLDSVLKGIDDMLKRAGDPAVKIELDVRDKCLVNIDKAQIEQVVMHLVVNSCEAMGGPGTITISVYKGKMTPHERFGEDGFENNEIPAAILEVKDDGIGLLAEDCSRAFEPFFTTKKDLRRHAGLGLATVYSIIARHDGDIALNSLRGKGATVKVYLPLVD